MTPKKPIKEVKAPNYEPDIGRLHNLVRAELAVVKAEDEKKAREEEAKRELIESYPTIVTNCTIYNEDIIKKYYPGIIEHHKQIKTRYSQGKLDRELKEWKIKHNIIRLRSIISSLGLGATAMFLILNT